MTAIILRLVRRCGLASLALVGSSAALTPALAQQSGIDVLSGFSDLWSPGATWDTGTPTAAGAAILRRNLELSREIARNRSFEGELSAYLYDRRDQSYTMIGGLGRLADIYRRETGAFTSILEMTDASLTQKFSDTGNGAGNSNSGLGKVVDFVGSMRWPATTTPAKNFYKYPRPYRQMLDGNSLVDIVAPHLRPAKSATPATDGGFPSGHANAAALAGFAFAYAVPQQFADEIMLTAEVAHSRVVAGMHSPLDVIGGRMRSITPSRA
ncbi:MAG: phosphatase PAP2 family protein [Bosea sp. (in: a-proteobacteria)]